jgi:hypothetical protein
VDELDLTALGSRMSAEQMSGLRAKVETEVENDKAPVARSGPSSLWWRRLIVVYLVCFGPLPPAETGFRRAGPF